MILLVESKGEFVVAAVVVAAVADIAAGIAAVGVDGVVDDADGSSTNVG